MRAGRGGFGFHQRVQRGVVAAALQGDAGDQMGQQPWRHANRGGQTFQAAFLVNRYLFRKVGAAECQGGDCASGRRDDAGHGQEQGLANRRVIPQPAVKVRVLAGWRRGRWRVAASEGGGLRHHVGQQGAAVRRVL